MASKVFKRNYSVFYYSHDKISQWLIILHGWQVKRPLSLLLTVGVGFINRTFLNFLSGHESLDFIWTSKHSKSSKKYLLNKKFILLEKQISSILWTFFLSSNTGNAIFLLLIIWTCVGYKLNCPWCPRCTVPLQWQALRSLSGFNFYTMYEKTFCNICAG